jgi:hypothetical protein
LGINEGPYVTASNKSIAELHKIARSEDGNFPLRPSIHTVLAETAGMTEATGKSYLSIEEDLAHARREAPLG